MDVIFVFKRISKKFSRFYGRKKAVETNITTIVSLSQKNVGSKQSDFKTIRTISISNSTIV